MAVFDLSINELSELDVMIHNSGISEDEVVSRRYVMDDCHPKNYENGRCKKAP